MNTKRILLGVLGILLSGLVWSAESGRVPSGFDRRPFEFRSELVETAANYRVYRWRFPSPQPPGWAEAAEVTAYYYCPNDYKEGDARRPAVVCLHILGGNGDETRIFAAHFASHGIPAVMPIMPMFGERTPSGGRGALLAGAKGAEHLAKAFLAIPPEIRRTADVLLTRPEVDPKRLNIMGTSLGGIMAATTAGQDKRFHKAVFLLAGGDLPRLLRNDTPEIKPIREALERAGAGKRQILDQILRSVDPVTYGKNLREKAAKGMVRLINAGEDKVVPRSSTLALASALGLTEKDVEFLPGLGHYTAIVELPNMLEKLTAFFRDGEEPTQVRNLPEVPEGNSFGPVLGELAAMCRWQPEPGCRLKLTADVVCRFGAGAPISGRIALIRGEAEQFQLSLSGGENLPKSVGSLQFGCGDYPWICAKSGRVYAGTLNGASEPMLSPALDSRWKQYQQFAVGALGLAALSTSGDLFGKQLQLSWVEEKSDSPTLRIAAHNIHALLQLNADGRTPRHLTVDAGQWQLEADILEWTTRAKPDAADFAPPAGAPVREVDARQLAGAMAAALNFILQQVR